MRMLMAFPGYETLAHATAKQLQVPTGELLVRHFPDGESLVQIKSDVRDKSIILVCGLDHADSKAMALMFFSKTAREMGARKIGLVAPYLGYMRQDKRFNDGEAITSNLFAGFISTHFDWLVTIDPHLHRHKSLTEIYSIPAIALHAADTIAAWIRDNISNPILIGPDEESEQWVADVAGKASAPFAVLRKIRHSDTEVEVSVPEVEKYLQHTPVLVDDIISTGMTMIETVKHLHSAGMRPPVCIGVHGVFSDHAYEKLQQAGVAQIATCNTISHSSNIIDTSRLISQAVSREITYP